MSFFTASRALADIKEGGGGKYIGTSGIYDITIDFVSVETNEHNARAININYSGDAGAGTLYGLKLDNNDLTPNYQAKIFNSLCNLFDLQTIADPVVETHNLGKDKTPTDLAVLAEFSGLDVKVRVKQTYGLYQGKLQNKLTIERFYAADTGATAQEIIEDLQVGEQLKKDLPFAEDIAYKDNLTAEKVAEMKKAKPTANSAQGPAPKVVVAKNVFGD